MTLISQLIPAQLNLDASAREYIEQLRSSSSVSQEDLEANRTQIYEILAPFGVSRPTPAQGEAESFLSSLAETKPEQLDTRISKSPTRERRSPSRDRRSGDSRDRRSHRDSRRGYSARDDYDTEEEEIKRKERVRQSQLKAYHERLRRWEAREVARDRKIQHDLQKDVDFEKNREYVERYLREYDDDKEMELGKDEYFRDRYAWYQQRQAFVRRERDYDDRDRQLEGTDELSNMNEEEKDQDVVMTPAEEPQNVGRIMTKEERESRIKELISKIPVDKEDLFAWPVRWDHLDEVRYLLAPELCDNLVDPAKQEAGAIHLKEDCRIHGRRRTDAPQIHCRTFKATQGSANTRF